MTDLQTVNCEVTAEKSSIDQNLAQSENQVSHLEKQLLEQIECLNEAKQENQNLQSMLDYRTQKYSALKAQNENAVRLQEENQEMQQELEVLRNER